METTTLVWILSGALVVLGIYATLLRARLGVVEDMFAITLAEIFGDNTEGLQGYLLRMPEKIRMVRRGQRK